MKYLVQASVAAIALLTSACGSGTAPQSATPAATPTPAPTPVAAVDTVIRTRPELFNLSDTRGDSVRVLGRQKYQTAVVAAINAQGGVCAHDDNEEIGIKVSNDFNEQFNVWTSAGYTRRSYITTCFPAQF